VEHEQCHVAEHAAQEQHLRDELAGDVNGFREKLVVPERDEETKHHVDDPDDDGDLHLERVQENYLVGRNLPDWIHSEGVRSPAVVGAVAYAGYQVGKMEGKFSNYHWDNTHSEYNFETWNKWRQADGFLCRNDTDCNWLDDYLECQKVGDFGWSINSDWFGGERPIGECGCEAWYDWNNDNLECELSDHGTYMTNG